MTKRFSKAIILLFILVITQSIALAESVDWSSATIIDVRTPEEWKSGHIEGALWIPWETIATGIKAYDIDKDQPLGFYCAAGVRADRAIRTLRKLGFSQTYNLINTRTAAKISGRKIVK